MRSRVDKLLDREIARRFTVSLMNNAKWRKALRILASPELGITTFRFKTVGEEKNQVCPMVWAEPPRYVR